MGGWGRRLGIGFGAVALLGMGVRILADVIASGEPLLRAVGAFTLLAFPLLALGAIVVKAVSPQVPRWRHGGGRSKAVVAVLVALLAGAGIFAAVTVSVPVRRPDRALTAALAQACQGIRVAAAASVSSSGEQNHLVVLGSAGEEHAWTGYPPTEWRPPTLDDAELVACISPDDIVEVLAVCHYMNGPNITRYSARRDVSVVDARRGQAVATFSIKQRPRACLPGEKMDTIELRAEVDWPIVEQHLASLVAKGVFVDPDAGIDPGGSEPTPQPTDGVEPTEPTTDS